MTQSAMPEPKPTAAQLIAELEMLQEAGDEIRARIKATIAELEANAGQILGVNKKQDGKRKNNSTT